MSEGATRGVERRARRNRALKKPFLTVKRLERGAAARKKLYSCFPQLRLVAQTLGRGGRTRAPPRRARAHASSAMELLRDVESLLDTLFWRRDDKAARLAALASLRRAASCEACVEEIRRLNGVDRLRKALAWDDEEAVDLAAATLAACSGSVARGPGVRVVTFPNPRGGPDVAVPIRETDYVEGGLGWRVWASAVVMCREMLTRVQTASGFPELLGADVLEVGAGCGLAGFLAARLGAKTVVFTDYLPGLLRNLDESVALNRDALSLVGSGVGSSPAASFRVHHLEWLAAIPGLAAKHARPLGGDGSCDANAAEAALVARSRALPDGETFSLILGSDVCYEDPLPAALAATLAARLADPGLAWLVLPVRDWPGESGEAVVRRLARECERRGLRAAIEPAPDLPEEEYEGGTFAKHPGGMVHVWVRRGGGGEEAAGATIRGGVDGTNAG